MHLKPGGVTTVISRQVAAITKENHALVITGDDPPADFSAPHVRIDGLGYDDLDFPEKDPPPNETAEAVISAIYEHWPDGCDVIHVHNPLLAKNSRLLSILDRLKQKGFNLFLQIHDFPEDGRPWSYDTTREYLSDCHYGVINNRDCGILIKSGLKPEGVHTLFNMVAPFVIRDVQGEAIPTVLYPVRGIRRKNIGEALLLSLYFPDDTPLAITLPPNSPMDWFVYKEWKEYAEKKALNAIFEASAKYDFRALVADARYLVTTSIIEGFGFAFLEPWTAGKALMGRKLPDICSDFEAKGIGLEHLYEKMLVPSEWMDCVAFEKRWKRCLRDTFVRYGAAMDESAASEGFATLCQNGGIDFSMLDEPFQRNIMDRLIGNTSEVKRFEEINPALKQFRRPPAFSRMISRNRDAIAKHYNQDAYRERLVDIYKKVITIRVRHAIDKSILLRQFLQPKNFSLMKWCDDELE